jgi:hypothetical protein
MLRPGCLPGKKKSMNDSSRIFELEPLSGKGEFIFPPYPATSSSISSETEVYSREGAIFTPASVFPRGNQINLLA